MKPQAHMNAADACPAREKLVAYSLGALPNVDIIHVADHLEHCAVCLETLNVLDDRTDPLVNSLAGIRDGALASVAADECRILQHLAAIGGRAPARAERKPPPRQLGPYEILAPLAEGGMGAVYKARHIYLGKIVALKFLSAERVADSLSIARFMQEMKALGQLSHPNIVQAYDAGVETVPFLAMEFLEGMDLARLVKERGPMSAAEACECVRQAALALQHASTCGLVHRDIKPANLLLTPDGCVKLLDLGLARFGADLPRGPESTGSDETITSAGAVMGTIDYIAPEQLVDSRSVDCRADLYSLGCTLYFLLTGVPPFGVAWEGNYAKRQAHLSEPSPNIRLTLPSVPEGLAIILERLLAKNPEFRFETPAELVAALEPLAAGCTLRGLADASVLGPGYPRPAPSSARNAPPAPRSHLFAWTLFGIAFLSGIALGLGFLGTRPARDSKEVGRGPEKKTFAIESFAMEHFRTEAKGVPSLGTIGARDVLCRDSFRITVRLSEPAHLYLLAYLPDGNAILCTPEQDVMTPTKTLVFPPQGLRSLKDPGLHAFVLLAARAPLPLYESWQIGPIAWPKNASAVAGAWRFDGKQISGLASGSSPPPAGFQELCRHFIARPGVDAVQAIAVAVQPDEPPAQIEPPPKK